jgi:S-adenosylmethionine:tRNA ribosyltransferase-isomerase
MSLTPDELDYELPPERIARRPAEPRDHSRLLVLDRATGERRHLHFFDLPSLLTPGDLLVVNDTRVLPARFFVRRETGGQLEGLYLRTGNEGEWWVMLKGAGRVKAGERLAFDAGGHALMLGDRLDETTWSARCEPDEPAADVLAKHGMIPLPPYIVGAREMDDAGDSTAAPEENDVADYQTVYARRPGAVAAPTAGLHFTDDLIGRLRTAGVTMMSLTLHVGAGTFAPVTAPTLAEHRMHGEEFGLPDDVAAAVAATKAAGRKVIAVGTTVVRVLETCADAKGNLRAGRGVTRLLIEPPYRFKAVDQLITNFHLPRSTLPALVFAFAGRERTLEAYREAISMEYRFYSYGDAMFVR